MSRYTQVPTQTSEEEMEAAFENSDDEGDDETHTKPLLSVRRSIDRSRSHPLSHTEDDEETIEDSRVQPASSDTYNFEEDWVPAPPLGSPPSPSRAIPNNWGNSNGYVPNSPVRVSPIRPSFFRRAVGAILPSHYAHGVRGGGLDNDGVFANVMAKPQLPGAEPIRGPEGANGPYWVPEETQKDAPPTYQTAQMDAVPGYWENTILAPSGPMDGDMIIDGLPIGSIFAFLWNLLVSVSFQFVGFLLTYLLHTTHASKYGSRAGLGVTLIQYGFYMRSADVSVPVAGDDTWSWPSGNSDDASAPTPGAGAVSDTVKNYTRSIIRGIMATPLPTQGPSHNATLIPDPSDDEQTQSWYAGDVTMADWLAFMMMTIGWFVLLTSLLGFWRVKRWERGVQASVAPPPERERTPEEVARDRQVLNNIELAFGINWVRAAEQEQPPQRDGAPGTRPVFEWI